MSFDSKVREALGELAASFTVGPVDEGGGVEITCKHASGFDISTALAIVCGRLIGVGFDVFHIRYGALHVAPERRWVPAGPWEPGWAEQ